MPLQVPTIPLLLTSSVVVHDHGVALSDTQERMRLTLESIGEWLRIDPALKIVICDGSNFDFSVAVKTKFPLAAIECLYFENNQTLVQQFGRGYGEGEIVRHALAHSRVLSQAGCFAKCTAKLWVDNYRICAGQWNGQLLCKGVFDNALSLFKSTSFSYVDTRFYIASVPFYKAHLETAHLAIDRNTGYGLEQSFHTILTTKRMERVLFNVYPIIQGVGGGTGKHYKNSRVRLLKEGLKIFLLRRNAIFRSLFTVSV